MFIFFWVLAKELLHSCFFFPGFLFGRPTPFTPFEGFFFLGGAFFATVTHVIPDGA